jgi:hypothetical protein
MPGHTYTEVSRAIHSEALCPRVRLVRTDPGAAGTGHGAYNAYTEALKNAGVMMGVNRLQPASTATTVRVANGKSQVLDGPYADSEEQLGGYYIIDVPDLDADSRGQRVVARLQVTVSSRCVRSGARRREVTREHELASRSSPGS